MTDPVNILDVTLDEVVNYDYHRFTYEIQPYGEVGYYFEYVKSGYFSGDPDGYDDAELDVYGFAEILGYFDGQLFVKGDIDYLAELYDADEVCSCYSDGEDYPDWDRLERIAKDKTETLFENIDYPDNAISFLWYDVEVLREFFNDPCDPNMTIRELIAQSKIFNAVG